MSKEVNSNHKHDIVIESNQVATFAPKSKKNAQTKIEFVSSILDDEEFLLLIKSSIPKGLRVDDFIRCCKFYLVENEKFLEFSKNTIKSCILKAAKDGLMLDGKEALLETRITREKSKIEYRALSWGMIKIIKKYTNIYDLRSIMVHSNDVFEYEEGDVPRIFHKINDIADRGDMIGCYAIARSLDGNIYRLVMSKNDIEKRKNRSNTKNVWLSWYDEMCQKTVISKLFNQSIKYLVHENISVLESSQEKEVEEIQDDAESLDLKTNEVLSDDSVIELS